MMGFSPRVWVWQILLSSETQRFMVDPFDIGDEGKGLPSFPDNAPL